MVESNEFMFVSRKDEVGKVWLQADFKGKVLITHVRAITDGTNKRKVASFELLGDSGKDG